MRIPNCNPKNAKMRGFEGLRAKRAALTTLLTQHLISNTVYEELVVEVDTALAKEVASE